MKLKFSILALAASSLGKQTKNIMKPSHNARLILALSVTMMLGIGGARASDILWSSSGGSAWLTGTNWTGNAVPTATDNAQFGANPSAASGVGINFNGTTNAGTQTNGLKIQDVGAIEITPARAAAMIVGNSSGTAGATGTLRLKGTTVNSVTNVILRNNSSQNLTIQNTQGSGNQTMSTSLGNATENKIVLDGSGNIVISNVIKSDSGTTPLTFMGAGSGRVDITGTANTFTGNINITGAEVRFSANGSLGNSANTVTVDGGRLGIANVASTTVDLTSRSIFLGSTAGTSISAPGQLTTILKYDGVLQDKSGSNGILVKQGAGILSLGGVSTYTGDTSINNGNLQLTTGNDRLPTGTVVSIGQAASTNLGTLDLNGRNQQISGLNSTSGTNATTGNNTVTSTAAATLTLGGSGTYSYGDGTNANSGVITGAISLVKNGNGTQTLGDTNTYTGTTTVEAGTLIINGNISTSLTTIKSGGTLGGSGYVGGLSVEGGGTLAPGNSPGILNVGNTSLASLSTFGVEINGNTVGTQYDQLNVTGTVSLAGLLSVSMGYTPADSALFFIIANDGLPTDAITGTFSNAPVDGGIYKLGGQDFKISYFGDSVTNSFIGGNDVVLMAIPEPSATLLVGGLGFLVMLRRRR